MDTYKKIQTYLRLAGLCSPSDSEKKGHYISEIEKLLTYSDYVEEIEEEDAQLDEHELVLLKKILKYGDMRVPKDWKTFSLNERINYTQDYLCSECSDCSFSKEDEDLKSVNCLSSAIVFHEILGNSSKKKMTNKLRTKINKVLREVLNYGYEKCQTFSVGLAYPTMRGYRKIDNSKAGYVDSF